MYKLCIADHTDVQYYRRNLHEAHYCTIVIIIFVVVVVVIIFQRPGGR